MSVGLNDVLRITADLLGPEGQHIQNVFYARHQGLISISDADAGEDCVGFVEDFYTPNVGAFPSDLSFLQVIVHNVTDDAPVGTFPFLTMTTGTGTANYLPTGSSLLIGLNTGVLRVHGRKYLPPMTEESMTSGDWNGSVLTAAAAMGAQLLTTFIGNGSGNTYLPGVVDKLGAFWGFIGAVVSGIPAYQRRRRAGTGF